MDICITAIEVVKSFGLITEVVLKTDLGHFSSQYPESPTLRAQAEDAASLEFFDSLEAPASYPIRGIKVFKRPGHPDEAILDIIFSTASFEGKGSPTISLKAPEGCAERYLISNLGIVPKVFQMSSGKSPKPTGLCSICFHRNVLGADGNLKKHREDLASWKFKKWCHEGLLQSEDRRYELACLEQNYPARMECGGSYLPPLESSPAGLLWAIKRHRQAIAGSQKDLGRHMDGSVIELYPYELGPHHNPDISGNERYHAIIKQEDPCFAQCMADTIQSLKDRIDSHARNIQSLKKLLRWVNRAHGSGAWLAPLDCIKAEHSVNFDVMSPSEARRLVAELMAETQKTELA